MNVHIELVTDKLRSDAAARRAYMRAWLYGFLQSLDATSLLYRVARAVIVEGQADIMGLSSAVGAQSAQVEQALRELATRLKQPASRAHLVEPLEPLMIGSFEELSALLQALTNRREGVATVY